MLVAVDMSILAYRCASCTGRILCLGNVRQVKGLQQVLTSMRAIDVTTVPFSARCHSIQTLLLASCALLELAMSRAARPALSKFSDVVLAACSIVTE